MARRTRESYRDGELVKKWFLSLGEEVKMDNEALFIYLVQQSFDVPFDDVTDIDLWREHFKPQRAFVQYLKTQMGYTQSQIDDLPPILKDVFKLFAIVAIQSIMYNWGRVPSRGRAFANWDDEEEIPV